MKKNLYGNIDDIVCNIKIVTCKGTLSKVTEWPRHSSGFDLNQVVLGHEGNFGVITEVVLRVRPLPDVSIHNSYIFPDYDTGCKFMEEVGKSRIWPASLRLVDNIQFQFGQALKTEQSFSEDVIDAIKKFYVTKIKGYNPESMTAATALFEGTREVTAAQKKYVDATAAKYMGLEAGPANGLRGYFLTFVIAYIRDLGQNYNFIAESFETSCPWKQVVPLSKNVTKRINDLCQKHGVLDRIFASFRVTQLYETVSISFSPIGRCCLCLLRLQLRRSQGSPQNIRRDRMGRQRRDHQVRRLRLPPSRSRQNQENVLQHRPLRAPSGLVESC